MYLITYNENFDLFLSKTKISQTKVRNVFPLCYFFYAVNVIMTYFKIQVLVDVAVCRWLGGSDVS